MENPSTVKILAGPSPREWELHRPTIRRLYLDEDWSLPRVMRIMQKEHRFKASTKMYKSRFKSWKMDSKNLKKAEIKQIAQTMVVRDAAGKRSAFQYRGRQLNEQNVVRHVKKHGFSTVADYVEAASPFAHNDEIRCYTPAESLHTPAESPPSFTAIQEYNENLNRHAAASPGNLSLDDTLRLRHVLSFSPEMRSRRLLSLSPVPRCPSPPMVLRVPEQLLWSANSFLRGNFDGNSWFLDSKGLLTSLKTPEARPNQTLSNCTTASELFGQRKHVQARQLLSEVCTTVEHQIRLDDPGFLVDLLNLLGTMQWQILFDIRVIILRHCALLARYLLGDQHPLTQLLSLLFVNLKEGDSEIYVQLMKCEINVLEKKIGTLHPATIYRRLSLIECVDPGEAVVQARILHATCQKGLTPEHTKWFYIAFKLAGALHRNDQGPEARDVLLRVLQDYDVAPPDVYAYLVKHMTLHMTLHLLSVVLFRMDDLAGAEQYSRLCLTSEESQRRWSKPDEKMFLNHRATILRAMGRTREAEEVEGMIENLLGPPEIPELLES